METSFRRFYTPQIKYQLVFTPNIPGVLVFIGHLCSDDYLLSRRCQAII